MSVPQFRLLVALDGLGRVPSSTLADALGMVASSVTRLVDRLQAAGLVQRGSDDRNRSIVTVEAMSAGAIPLLYASGGSVEIIGDHGVGALWTSIEELVSASLAIFSDEQEARRQAAKCAELASAYAPEEFARRTRKAVNAVLRATAPLVVPRP